jgi:hypothetical protein
MIRNEKVLTKINCRPKALALYCPLLKSYEDQKSAKVGHFVRTTFLIFVTPLISSKAK